MKPEKLFKLIGEADETFVAEAAEYPKKESRSGGFLLKFAAAACLAVVIGGAAWFVNMQDIGETPAAEPPEEFIIWEEEDDSFVEISVIETGEVLPFIMGNTIEPGFIGDATAPIPLIMDFLWNAPVGLMNPSADISENVFFPQISSHPYTATQFRLFDFDEEVPVVAVKYRTTAPIAPPSVPDEAPRPIEPPREIWMLYQYIDGEFVQTIIKLSQNTIRDSFSINPETVSYVWHSEDNWHSVSDDAEMDFFRTADGRLISYNHNFRPIDFNGYEYSGFYEIKLNNGVFEVIEETKDRPERVSLRMNLLETSVMLYLGNPELQESFVHIIQGEELLPILSLPNITMPDLIVVTTPEGLEEGGVLYIEELELEITRLEEEIQRLQFEEGAEEEIIRLQEEIAKIEQNKQEILQRIRESTADAINAHNATAREISPAQRALNEQPESNVLRARMKLTSEALSDAMAENFNYLQISEIDRQNLESEINRLQAEGGSNEEILQLQAQLSEIRVMRAMYAQREQEAEEAWLLILAEMGLPGASSSRRATSETSTAIIREVSPMERVIREEAHINSLQERLERAETDLQRLESEGGSDVEIMRLQAIASEIRQLIAEAELRLVEERQRRNEELTQSITPEERIQREESPNHELRQHLDQASEELISTEMEQLRFLVASESELQFLYTAIQRLEIEGDESDEDEIISLKARAEEIIQLQEESAQRLQDARDELERLYEEARNSRE